MRAEADITIARAPEEVFDYLAHAERLPEYVTDFAWVKQSSDGEPSLGTEYSYEMERGHAHGTFEWTRFEPGSRLAWSGPPAHAALGSMAPEGQWSLSELPGATHLTLVMAPKPSGVFKAFAPLMSPRMRKGNEKALARLKEKLEHF